VKVSKGSKKFQFELFCRKVVAMDVDLNVRILGWGVEGFSKLHGCIKKEDVKKLKVIVVEKRWDGLLPHNSKLRGNNTWSICQGI
jgi:hypothetical protein